MPSVVTAHDRAITSGERHRLPQLDGLRSVAVLLVVAFHSGISALRGGFVGVDVFFVLSGFVIVRAMLAEADRSGTIRLSDFWRRRIARLVPAMVVCVVVSAGLFTLTSSPPERVDVLADARASLLSVSNWWFLNQSTDYFRDAVESSPFLHMWSLSAEEQFYVVLPLVFLAACRWLRTPRDVDRRGLAADDRSDRLEHLRPDTVHRTARLLRVRHPDLSGAVGSHRGCAVVALGTRGQRVAEPHRQSRR